GSDHPGVIEALARARSRGEEVPAVVICPHETTAMSAAHGYALATGNPQAVFVHTDVGTANLGGSMHNAARSRVPVFVFAGLTPYSLEGELPGTRNSHVNHLQDVHDQHGLVRPYVKWSYDIRTGTNVKQLVFRALQIANSAPRGPVYLTGAREVLAQSVATRELATARWQPIAPIPAPVDVTRELVEAIAGARFPLLITSHLGGNPDAVGKLVRFAEAMGVGVVETTPSAMNFPATHPLHLGYIVDELIAEADVIVAVDTDSPWIISRCAPAEGARVFFIDPDPLKEDLPLWYMESDRFIRADSEALLDQLIELLPSADRAGTTARTARFTAIHNERRAAWQAHLVSAAASLSTEAVCSVLGRLIDDDTVVLNEAITNSGIISRHLPRVKPGTMFANAGTSLGWSGGAAVGVKLARPDSTVVSLVGDGTYFLTVPSSTYWVAQHYAAPVLTVILDNGGWNATKQNLIKQHPAGIAHSDDRYWVNLAQSADLPGIAHASGGAFAATVRTLAELEGALIEALAQVRGGRAAVVSIQLPAISHQPDEAAGPRQR
ncbi:MAG TPA: thiamine pyrophosphate-requiring protein, partial [Terrimesophilobacter sp.]|nr:thiamine pyrophosphate-requiring protein [Terrimesophilobacter sp.]